MTSTGLKPDGAGEWLVEKHGASRRRSWRKSHISVDVGSGEIVAIELTLADPPLATLNQVTYRADRKTSLSRDEHSVAMRSLDPSQRRFREKRP